MKRKKYFTVIELLVVLAVVMVIFSVLCHSLSRAKEIARRAYCLNNLKQISTLANLYNIDRGSTPYTSNWLVDFTFCSDYLQSYKVLECPSMNDRVNTLSDLNGNTSYHYMGSRQDWLRNNIASGDGTEYGFDATNPSIANLVTGREEKIVYDKTDSVHAGIFNVVYIESSSADYFRSSQSSSVWFVTESGSLNFPEGTAVASAASSTAVTVADTGTGGGSGGSSTALANVGSDGTSDNSSTSAGGIASTGGTAAGTTVAGTTGTGTAAGTTSSTTTSTTSTTTVASTDTGHTNNGHGNNVDGVDSSNPGNSKTGEDSNPAVDDESKGGTTTSTTSTTTTTTTTGGTSSSTTTTTTDDGKTNNGKKK